MYVLFYCFIIGAAYLGWGKALILVTKKCIEENECTPISFQIWAGWSISLVAIQFIHFFYPINFFSFGIVLAIGLILSITYFDKEVFKKNLHFSTGALSKCFFRIILVLVITVIIVFCIIARSMLPPRHYDSGLYHFNAIRWANEYPLIPGLGNLHGRLAFNSSFFSYVAGLNLYPFFCNGRSIANSFLTILTILTLLELLLPMLREPILVLESPPLEWATPFFCFPYIVYWSLSSDGINSPSPDLSCSLIQVIIFIIFNRLVSKFVKNRILIKSEVFILSILSATVLTVKLSNIAFCITAVAFIFFLAFFCKNTCGFHDMALFVLPSAFILIVFFCRGIILSGAPIYPSTLGYLDLEWSVPLCKILDERDLVYGWARLPGENYKNALVSWDWFGPWIKRLIGSTTEISFPLLLFFVLIILMLIPIRDKKKPVLSYPFIYNAMLIPIIISFLFWFFTAPDPRFANACFVLLSVSGIVLFWSKFQLYCPSDKLILSISVMFFVTNIHLLRWFFVHFHFFDEIFLNGSHEIKKVGLDQKFTSTGLQIYVPVIGDQCWDAPLPCTPYFNDSLRLIDANNILKGFSIKPLHKP